MKPHYLIKYKPKWMERDMFKPFETTIAAASKEHAKIWFSEFYPQANIVSIKTLKTNTK